MVFEAAARVTDNFAGKVFLCTGDLRQLTPVVKSACALAQINASPVNSKLWPRFEIFVLRENMRQAEDPEYADFITRLGEGKDGSTYIRRKAAVDIAPFVQQTFASSTMEDAVDFVYPGCTEAEQDPLNRAKLMAKSAILAHTNDRVAFWNHEVQQLLPLGVSKSFFSANKLCDVHDNDANAELLTLECLQYCDAADVPTHHLKLHVGDLCILMRNIDKPLGLTNNQRVIIRALRASTIGVSIARDDSNTVHWLPRIHFRFVMPGTSFEMIRTQFPLKLAYAFTVHKAQGQELQRVLLDTTTPVFAHGQLYVALSRVRTRGGIGAFVNPEQVTETVVPCTNIVFEELIRYVSNDLHIFPS